MNYFEALSIGARRTLELFDWFRSRHFDCYPTLQWLADKLKASKRSICRWTAELASAGAIRKGRRGPHSNLYALLWQKPWTTRQIRLFPTVENSCGNVENGESLATLSGVPPLSELEEEKTKTMLAENRPEEKDPNQTPEPGWDGVERRAAAGWSDTEREAVVGAVQEFQYQGRGRVVAEPELIARLGKIASYYQCNGFRVAAEFERVRRHVERRPSTAPCKPSWFCAVLEARLKRATEEKKSVTSEPRGVITNGALFIGWSAEELAELAALEIGHGEAAGPQAEPATARPSMEAVGEERIDTEALLRGLAAEKDLRQAIHWVERRRA